MGGRTKVVDDASELVPLLRTFGSTTHKKVFDSLLTGWHTAEELSEMTGESVEVVERSLMMLRRCGLVDSQWRMVPGAPKPVKEYTCIYTKAYMNFRCSMNELAELIQLTFASDGELQDDMEKLTAEIESGNKSLINLSRVMGKSPMYIKGLARRTDELVVKGQRIDKRVIRE